MNQKIDPEIMKKVQEWLSSDIDDTTKKDLQELIQKDPQKVKNSFYKKLDFGTGGIRAIVGIGVNRLNQYTIQMASQGLANYLKKQLSQDIKVVIGYDNRVHSRFFAEQTARVLAANQIKVYLFKQLRPTPFISFSCRYLKCSAAVMITASHNGPEYNGFKVYWEDGAQVLPPHDKGIIDEYSKIEKIDQIHIVPLTHSLIQLLGDELDEKYLCAIERLQLCPKINKSQGNLLKIIYTNLHGTGIVLTPKSFQKWGFIQCETVKKQESTDGQFPYAKDPNPEKKETLALGIEQLKQTNSDILIANDPDADRMAAVILHQNEPVILTGNQISALLCYHICKSNSHLPSNAAFIKSIVTTDLFQEIVHSFHFSCVEVLTGFKYISEKIRIWETTNEHTFILGVEESYGYLVGDCVRDKDGISSACLLAELALQAKLNHKTLLDLLFDLYQTFGIYREKQLSLTFEDSSVGMTQMTQIMDNLRSSPPDMIGSFEITAIEDYKKGIKFDTLSKKEESLGLPSSNVLTFRLIDNTKLIIRPSGTEPKIKIYGQISEKNTSPLLEKIAQTDQRLEGILEIFKHTISQ